MFLEIPLDESVRVTPSFFLRFFSRELFTIHAVVAEQAGPGAAGRAPRARNAAEGEYLAKLQAIRRQNYLEKKRILGKASVARDVSPQPLSAPREDPMTGGRKREEELEARRKKIAALKVSSDISRK